MKTICVCKVCKKEFPRGINTKGLYCSRSCSAQDQSRSRRPSKISKFSDEEFLEIVKESTSYSDVARKLGIFSSGNSYQSIPNRIKRLNIDTSHFTPTFRKSIDLELVAVEDSKYTRHTLKKRIIKHNLIPYVCKECEQEPEWNGKELVLVLDHINGINNDNRLENLRFLCPNCNAQQPTFAGKNKRR